MGTTEGVNNGINGKTDLILSLYGGYNCLFLTACHEFLDEKSENHTLIKYFNSIYKIKNKLNN